MKAVAHSRRRLAQVILLMAAVAGGWLTAKAQDKKPAPVPPYAGAWVGRGVIWELTLDETRRKLSRWSDTDFWFTIDPAGKVSGQGHITFQAELNALRWPFPAPGKGRLEAAVHAVSEPVFRQYALTGAVSPAKADPKAIALTLAVTGEHDSLLPGPAFAFRFRTPAVFAGAKSAADIQTVKISAQGWSPFQGLTAAVLPHAAGPYVAAAHEAGPTHRIDWYAHQIGDHQPAQLAAEVKKLTAAVEELRKKAAAKPK